MYHIGAGVEGGVLPIIEPRAPKFDGAENLHALALSGNRDFWRATHAAPGGVQGRVLPEAGFVREDQRPVDRKSTRLNSSHGYISYAVFCLKKKKKKNTIN